MRLDLICIMACHPFIKKPKTEFTTETNVPLPQKSHPHTPSAANSHTTHPNNTFSPNYL